MTQRYEDASHDLFERLEGRTKAGGIEWLRTAVGEIASDESLLPLRLAAVGRRMGHAALVDANDPVRLSEGEGPVLNAWTVPDAGRACLLLADAAARPEGVMVRARERYFEASGDEKTGVLRTLQLLGESDDAVACLEDAIRANTTDLVSAAMCENAYTSACLPDPMFFQGVLKCVFMGIRIDRIERVEARTTPELGRMLFSFVTEREHAGRPVPVEVWPVLALAPPEDLGPRIDRLLEECEDDYERSVLRLALERVEGGA